MTQIIIDDYFNIMRDDYGRIYCIQEIGDPKELIKAIREQNEYIKTKEQECERLKKIIDEAKNSKLDLKSFLVGEAIQNEYEQQLDQLKMVNDSLKSELMQTNCYLDTDKETIDQLKAEKEELEKELRQKKMTILMNNDNYIEVDQENKKLKQPLQEIKEIAEKDVVRGHMMSPGWLVQRIKEAGIE